MLIERDGAAGAYSPVTVRGQRDDGVLVLLDGRPIAGGEIGDLDLGSMPTAGVERIEVVEGAGATLYGNDASGGVINIITARSRSAYRTPEASYSPGSYGTQRVAFETSTFSFAREIAANDFPYPVPGTGNATRTNADLSATNARFTDAGTFGAFQLSGSAGFSSRLLGVPGQLGSLTSFARQADDASDARVSLALDRSQAVTTLDLSASRQTLAFADPSAGGVRPVPRLQHRRSRAGEPAQQRRHRYESADLRRRCRARRRAQRRQRRRIHGARHDAVRADGRLRPG